VIIEYAVVVYVLFIITYVLVDFVSVTVSRGRVTKTVLTVGVVEFWFGVRMLEIREFGLSVADGELRVSVVEFWDTDELLRMDVVEFWTADNMLTMGVGLVEFCVADDLLRIDEAVLWIADEEAKTGVVKFWLANGVLLVLERTNDGLMIGSASAYTH
jgi:hypothetical protein